MKYIWFYKLINVSIPIEDIILLIFPKFILIHSERLIAKLYSFKNEMKKLIL